MTASDLLAAHVALRVSRPDEDGFYQAYMEDPAATTLRSILVRLVARAASFLARRVRVARNRVAGDAGRRHHRRLFYRVDRGDRWNMTPGWIDRRI
jgi:hypothetical protein